METNIDLSKLSKPGFFLLILSYAVLLLTDLPPSEDARRFPLLILSSLVVLIGIRLAILARPQLGDRLVDMRDLLAERFNLDSGEDTSDELSGYQSSFRGEESDWRADMRNAVWIVGGFAMIYVAGLYIGGFGFTFLYIYFRSEQGLLAGLAIALGSIGGLFLVSEALSIRVWEGLYGLPL